MDLDKFLLELSSIELRLLPHIKDGINFEDLVSFSGMIEAQVMGGLQLLESRKVLEIKEASSTVVVLDKNGTLYKESGLPEKRFMDALEGDMTSDDLLEKAGLERQELNICIGQLKKLNLVDVKKDENKNMIFTITSQGQDFKSKPYNVQEFLSKDFPVLIDDLKDLDKKIFDDLTKRRQIVKKEDVKSYSISLLDLGKEVAGKEFDLGNVCDELTPEIIKEGNFDELKFRRYDVSVPASFDNIGRHHPMLEANSILKDIFIEMGFQEMEGPMVESAFWNMDSMWIPQDHPARDEQDTFYLEGKADVEEELVLKIKDMHENGIKKAHTPKGEWSKDITQKRLLRTHSTATSFRKLAELGMKLANGENVDGKYFYVAHNFRNEAIDATHLAEFFQGEGFIIGDNLSLAHLMGFVREYYAKLGITKIKFKPTFNPYTEPSMEAHYYDEKMGKWYALINSGIFRQETLEPFGLGGKTVIAWGMGASRVATLLAGKHSMRDITGVTCDINWLKTRPMMTRKIVKRN